MTLKLKILSRILDFFFPQNCAGCGLERETICPICLNNMDMPDTAEDGFIYAATSYKDKTVRNAIWNLKYKKSRQTAKPIAEIIRTRCLPKMKEKNVDLENFIAIPIPPSKERAAKRGFNQAEEIAKGLPFKVEAKILLKIKNTPSQVSVKIREKRLLNIKGSFKVANPEIIKGRNIVIIDDVLTTGATIKEAKKVLLAAGAKKILAIVAAR